MLASSVKLPRSDIIISAKEAMYSSAVLIILFVCCQDYAKTTQSNFTKFGEQRWHTGNGMKPLDFGGNPNHVWLALGLR